MLDMIGGRLSPEKEAYFSRMNGRNYRITSEETAVYNCIAYAAHDADAWWWPVEGIPGVHWPEGVPCEETVEAFLAAYATLGFKPCADATHELGIEKIALYCDELGTPTHAARQLASGRWTSKLGEWEDIEHHAPDVLESQSPDELGYGIVTTFLSRSLALVG